MERTSKGAWIIALAALISGLILGYVLPRQAPSTPPSAPSVEGPAAAAPAVPVAPPPPAPVVIEGPLAYSTGNLEVSVRKEVVPVSSLFDAQRLRDNAVGCGAKHPSGYFGKLMAKFEGSDAQAYVFHYEKPSQDPADYAVAVVPNAPGYEDLAAFRKDFDVCDAGGERYPWMTSAEWLVFVGACGTGFDDGSGRPVGCEEIRRVVEPSLQLKLR